MKISDPFRGEYKGLSMSTLSNVDLPREGVVTSNRMGGKAMKKTLVAYVSRTGKTETIAESIAEGIRFN
jgi:hypothetical protein